MSILSSQVYCTSVPWSTTIQTAAIASLKANPPVATQAGAIYLGAAGSKLISTSNLYTQCYNSQDGGAFYLVNSQLTENLSQFVNIYALYGSVMKCIACTFTFTDSVLDGNQALSGGVFMVEDAGSGTALRTSFKGTQAVN